MIYPETSMKSGWDGNFQVIKGARMAGLTGKNGQEGEI